MPARRIVELLGEGEMGAAYLADVLPKRHAHCSAQGDDRCSVVKQEALRKLFVTYAKRTSKVVDARVLQTLDAGIDQR